MMTVLPFPVQQRETSVQPPADSSLSNFFAQPSRECGILPSTKLTAWLDHTDRVMNLPAAWNTIAALTGAPDMEREKVLGRPVGWFIADETVRECFRVILEQTRREKRAVRIVSRCDWPGESRAMQLRFAPMSAGAIECTWAFIQGPAAEEIPTVRRRRFCDGEHLRMCSWCRQVHVRAAWHRLDTAASALGLLHHSPLPPITHGICPQCSTTLMAENAQAMREPIAV